MRVEGHCVVREIGEVAKKARSRSSCGRRSLRGREGKEDCRYVCVLGSFLNYQLKN